MRETATLVVRVHGDSGVSERDNVIMVGEEVSRGVNEGDAVIMVGGLVTKLGDLFTVREDCTC